MKDSGIEWIGEIPEDWEVTPLGKYFRNRVEKVSDLDFEPLSVTKQGVVKQLENAAKSANHNDRKKVCMNDFVINSRSDRKQSCGLSPYEGSVSLINIVLEINDLFPNYVKYLLDNYGFAEEFYRWGTGIVADLWSTRFDLMKKIPLPIPLESEQQAIANFLDQKVSEIDHILEKTRESIEEYKKYKQSLITEAVTKGLNPDVEMKDSGIEWIGEIPKHWEVERIKNNFTVLSGATPKSENSEYWDGDITWATPADYKTEDVYIFNTKRTITEEGLSSCGTNLVPKDSIIVSNRAPIGAIALAGVELCTNQGCKALVRKKNISTKFIYYYLSVMSSPLNMLGRGTTFMELSTSDLNNLYIPIGPIDEQYKIIDYLDSKCIGIYKLIYKKRQLLSDLETYKKSLIYECVTGKREVD